VARNLPKAFLNLSDSHENRIGQKSQKQSHFIWHFFEKEQMPNGQHNS